MYRSGLILTFAIAAMQYPSALAKNQTRRVVLHDRDGLVRPDLHLNLTTPKNAPRTQLEPPPPLVTRAHTLPMVITQLGSGTTGNDVTHKPAVMDTTNRKSTLRDAGKVTPPTDSKDVTTPLKNTNFNSEISGENFTQSREPRDLVMSEFGSQTSTPSKQPRHFAKTEISIHNVTLSSVTGDLVKCRISSQHSASFSESLGVTTVFFTNQTLMYTHGNIESSKIYLSTGELTRCLQSHGKLVLRAQTVIIDYIQQETGTGLSGEPPFTCMLDISVSQDMRLDVRYVNQTCIGANFLPSNFVSISDAPLPVSQGERWSGCEERDVGHVLTVSNVYLGSSSISIGFTVKTTNVNYTLQMNVTAVPRLRLETLFVSTKLRFIQTPGWKVHHGEAVRRPVDDWVSVRVPAGDVAMVSFHHAQHIAEHYVGDICYGTVELYQGSRSKQHLLWSGCYTMEHDAFPLIINTTVLHVHYVTHEDRHGAHRGMGFRLTVSFHKLPHLPRKLPGGTWNCSAALAWNDVIVHFVCGDKPRCSNGEDNTACPDTGCRPGQFLMAGKCLAFRHAETDLMWTEAVKRCAAEGMRLAVLSDSMLYWDLLDDAVLRWRQRTFATVEQYPDSGHFFEFFQNFDTAIRHKFFIGLSSVSSILPQLYKSTTQWLDGSVAYNVQQFAVNSRLKPLCAIVSIAHGRLVEHPIRVRFYYCATHSLPDYLCEMRESTSQRSLQSQEVKISTTHLAPPADNHTLPIPFVVCPDKHLTHSFLACDVNSACFADSSDYNSDLWWGRPSSASCPAPMTSLPPSFTCENGWQLVPYSLVCDYRHDCQDRSDETFCPFTACTGTASIRCGDTAQCFFPKERCDGKDDCLNRADEGKCDAFYRSQEDFTKVYKPPAVIFFDGLGHFHFSSLNQSESCPPTHFRCPHGFCLPVYVRCNGVYDCPGHEDEVKCGDYICPGHYRCRASSVCVHPTHVCDGVQQCPQQDDELFCHLTCPEDCTCHGLAFVCTGLFASTDYTELRYLDASGTGMTPRHLSHNAMLVHLSLARCNLSELHGLSFPILLSLDLSDNQLVSVDRDDLRNVSKLRVLSLAGNPLTSLFPTSALSQTPLPELMTLDLSRVIIPVLDLSIVSLFTELQTLNLSGSGVECVLTTVSRLPSSVGELDIRGCSISEFPRDFLKHLGNLRAVHADTFRLCCPAVLPSRFNPRYCHAPSDVMSSCDDLIGSSLNRIILSVSAVLALTGNIGSLVLRAVFGERDQHQAQAWGLFVNCLCMSDFLMGVYLSVIGVADLLYQGRYVWEDERWRHSVTCKVASFFVILSNEASALILSFITFDRLLVIFRPSAVLTLRSRKLSKSISCTVLMMWITGIMLASTPLMPVTSHWRFYSQTGICAPLPITSSDFPGHKYFFGVSIILNSVLHVFVAVGQASIYTSIRMQTITTVVQDTSSRPTDLNIARRFVIVAMCDAVCWLLISSLAMLASQGVPFSSEVNVFLAIVIVPGSSALNPFLYGLSVVLEHRRVQQERRLMARLVAHTKAKIMKQHTQSLKK